MAPRLQLEKAAWRWTETVPPEAVTQEHIEAAYRIGLEPCQRGACRRNCRGNPNCLVGIGEHIWLGEIDENTFHNIDDPNFERRKKNAFVGLTNLGATCYVNTFLQMWFLNLELRQALYLCPDAQEFSKLFMSLLEDTLSSQKNPDVRDIVQKQFCGEYAYVTVCNQCGRESKLISKFYELELNIQGHKQLSDCITEFLKEEKLEGDNRYFCESCQSKQNATRRIRLLSLPCTLNLQLMRFVFDSVFVYELSAILIHRGVSAYSGHYIAHVKDPQTGEWYRFNDEEIEKMEGKKLQLGAEEDLEPSKSQSRRPKCGKGIYRSRNAYMLVYRLQSREKSLAVELPAFLQELVEQDNSRFEEWCHEMAEMRKQSVARGKVKHEEVKELYQKLPAKAGLVGSGKAEAPPCRRAEKGGPACLSASRPPSSSSPVKALCKDCVVERCRVLRLKSRLSEDYKAVCNLLKAARLYRSPAGGNPLGLQTFSSAVRGREEPSAEKREEEELKFNEDIVCPHGEWGGGQQVLLLWHSIALIWPDEWEKIRKLFVVDHAIRVIRREAPQESTERLLYMTEPELCLDCREGLLYQQQRDLREYTQATIYVRKVVDDKKVGLSPPPLLSSQEIQSQKC
ncbi:Ubiquitin carboxyl-terminal hydrolase 48 [Ophiophagus hannah]|uniref:ubiquitinyl hydrolase 1 n=1 Tax=Ophiophagus hannah TaxID=8665 RepID=V8NDE6_OPHHA|nr:Ubiquitin carboxyl-terminal hydrolase 48 [Ophiophagus hannah]